MPFGLANAPATFQAYINRALAGLVDVLCVVYLDDILIYTHDADLERHWIAVRKVLDRLRNAQLFANLKKCSFAVSQVEYLGFIVSTEGVQADPKRVATIQEWPAPHTIKELQGFLGLTNFYRRFIAGYSRIVAPLTALTRKDAVWQWEGDAERAFNQLIDAFQHAPILRHFNVS